MDLSFENSRNRKDLEVSRLDVMTVEFFRNSHDGRVSEIGDSTSSTSVLLLEHTMPVDRFSECFFFDKVESLTKNSFGSTWSLIVLNSYSI